MSAEQKALLRQLQLAGLGLVTGAVGLFTGHPVLPFIGGGIFLLGIGRTVLVKKLQDRTRDMK